jgi:hypothetical protein
MLLFSGAGSMISGKLRSVVLPASAAMLALIAYRFGLDAFLRATLAQPLAIRIALALACLSVPATLMGMPFPAAVQRLDRDLVVRGWVINGYCSVVGSCLAMIVSISSGFHVVLLVGAALYGAAAALWPSNLNVSKI